MTEPEKSTGWRMHAGFGGDADATASSAAAFGSAEAEVGTEPPPPLALWVGCLTKVAGPLLAALILIVALETNPIKAG